MSQAEHKPPVTAWLDVLSAVFPPRGILVVGAGNGAGPWVQWLRQRRASPAWLVEGDDVQYQHLRRYVAHDQGWVLRHDVVAATTDPVPFYRASNPAESGLVGPDQLQALWPHLTATHVQAEAAAVTLDGLAQESGLAFNWLVLDCMPAATLLQGGMGLLEQADVVVVRVAFDDRVDVDSSARQAAASAHLEAAGLSPAQAWPQRHPALAHVLYVRDVGRQAERLAATRGQAAQLEQELHHNRETTAQLRTEHQLQLKMEREAAAAQHQSLEQARAALDRCQQELTQAQEVAERLRDEHSAQLKARNVVAEQAAAKEALQQKVLQQTPTDAPGALDGTAQRGKQRPSVTTQIDLPSSLALGLYPNHPERVQEAGDDMKFDTPNGAPLYFVSNEHGGFDAPSPLKPIRLRPDTGYQLSGQIVCEGGSRPQAWIFQYDAVHKIAGESVPVDEKGHFRLPFKTLPNMQSVAVGVRVAGTGRLLGSPTTLRLSEQPAGEVVALPGSQVINPSPQAQRRDIDNAVRQLEACIRLQHYLGPETLLPQMHRWAISPDFGVMLIQLVEQHAYDAVVEFGSGTSTLVLAKALARVARRDQRPPAPLLSFDHLDQYQRQSQRGLAQAGLTLNTSVELAPLAPWKSASGEEFAYYTSDKALTTLKRRLTAKTAHVLVVVDGPPAGTGPRARYPALNNVLKVFGAGSHVHFLMDDYLREDEQAVVKAWEAELSASGRPYVRSEFNELEKKACLLDVQPSRRPVHEQQGKKE